MSGVSVSFKKVSYLSSCGGCGKMRYTCFKTIKNHTPRLSLKRGMIGFGEGSGSGSDGTVS